MFSEKEKQEIAKALSRHHKKRGASLEALKTVQRHRGWVDDDSLKELAPLLDMTAEELDGVATFYSLIFRRPVGAHVILLCNTVTCWVMRYEMILDHLKARLGIGLGETSADGRFTLLPVPCLGACDQAPVMMIDDDLHGNLTPERVDELLRLYGWEAT